MLDIKKHENEHLKSILDATFDEIVILDKNFNILTANMAFCKNYGVTPKSIKGNKCYQVTHGLKKPCNSKGWLCPLIEVLKTGTQFECIHSHKNQDHENTVELLTYPIKTTNNKIEFIVKIGRIIGEKVKLQEDILEPLEMLNTILSTIDNSVLVISNDFKILYMNNNAEKEFGKNLIGKLCYKSLKYENMPCTPCVLNEHIVNHEKKVTFKTNIIDYVNNQSKNFEFNCIPIKSYNGKPALINIIKNKSNQDNTEKLLKDSEERYKILLDNFPYPMFLLNSEGIIYDYNSSVELYLNLPENNLLNNNFFDIFKPPEDQVDEFKEILYYVYEFNLNEIKELKIRGSNNNSAWIESFFSSITLNNKKLIQVIVHDITENKLVENIIKEENQRLRKLNEVKKQLTSQTSEELKSPLSQMFDASQILLDSYKDKLDKKAKNLLELIVKGGETSLDLVGRIVDISRFESDNFKLIKRTESLIEILRNSIEEALSNPIYSKNVLELDCTLDLYSDVDKVRIEQVIKEILSKIIRDSKPKNTINISLKQDKNFAEICIQNRDDNDSKKENQIENINNEAQESLYGLYFSKEIIELHGGQISVENNENQKRFIYKIKLPLKNWNDSLIQIFILCKSGIPLYSHQFTEDIKNHDFALISGGIIGMMTILKEIIQGDKEIKTIDHGDRKMLVETNITKDIIFALLVKENLVVFNRRLNAFIEEFDTTFKHLITNIRVTSGIIENWTDIEDIVQKHFGN